jgi:V-type H+-transporting ATPase subunit D
MVRFINTEEEITRRIDEAKRKMGRVMQIAAFSLAEVTYAVGGDIGYQVQESAKSARFRVRTKQENVSGVFLPAFESYTTEGNNDFGLTGLGKGGQQVQRCRETYARAVETLVELASLQVGQPLPVISQVHKLTAQTAFVILDEVIKVVNRRGSFRSPSLKGNYTNFRSERDVSTKNIVNDK